MQKHFPSNSKLSPNQSVSIPNLIYLKCARTNTGKYKPTLCLISRMTVTSLLSATKGPGIHTLALVITSVFLWNTP